MRVESETCELNPAYLDWFDEISAGQSSPNACRVRQGNACGSGSLIGWHNGGSLVMSNWHVASGIGREASCQFRIGSQDITRTGRIILGAYSNRVTADWCIIFIPDWQVIRPVWGSRARPAGDDRFYTTGSPSCVYPLRSQSQSRILSNNNQGFVTLSTPAVPGQSGSAMWSHKTNWQQLLITWRTGSGNTGAQPLDYIWTQAQTAMQTGALIGGPMPDGVERLSGSDEELEEGFFAEASIRALPIWAEDQSKPEPDPTPDPQDPPQPLPVPKAALVESYRKIRDEASEMLAKLEIAADSTPIVPPAGSPTFGL
jgi:hypothetical protein